MLLFAQALLAQAAPQPGDEITVSGTTLALALTAIGGFATVLLSIIGYLVNDKLKTIHAQNAKVVTDLGTLSENQAQTGTHVAEIKAHVKHHAEKIDEFCDRLKAVEDSTHNTERIAVLEKENKLQGEEISRLRPVVHSNQTDLGILLSKLNALELTFGKPVTTLPKGAATTAATG